MVDAEHTDLRVTEVRLREWLGRLNQPDRLDDSVARALLTRHGRLPWPATQHQVGLALSTLLREKIEELDPGPEASREARFPYLVLTKCFLRGTKAYQAANSFSISRRQMTRERSRAISLLAAQLDAPTVTYPFEGIPDISPGAVRASEGLILAEALHVHRCVMIVGPAGSGKTSLAAAHASSQRERSVFWRSLRRGVNDTLSSLLLDLALYLAVEGSNSLRNYVTEAFPELDPTIASHLAIEGLSRRPRLLVFDDCDRMDRDGSSIPDFVDELVVRIPSAQVVMVSRTGERIGRTPVTLVELPSPRAGT